MSELSNTKKDFYFTTRDLLVMAVLAALGGVTSTYVNAISDAVHAALGFAGGSQWAAGLHVIWIVLAMGILKKSGAATLTGVLKGVVELMSGNSHGVIILLVDLVAGMLVDFGFLLFKQKRNLLPYLLGGGLATASNVLVFQLFATIPINILGLTAIFILFFVALISGIIFAGILPYLLVNALAKAGVVKAPEQPFRGRKIGWWILLGFFMIAILVFVFLKISFQGPDAITIDGAVETPYEYSDKTLELDPVTREMDANGVMTEYSGYPLVEIIDHANPNPNADTLLIEATDGYAFLISFDELTKNENVLLVKQGKGNDASFNIVGPESSKAWVRNVSNLTIIISEGLSIIYPSGEKSAFDPDEWKTDMDSTQVALPSGSKKLQGVPVWKVIDLNLEDEDPASVTFKSLDDSLELEWSKIEDNDKLRVFTVIEDDGIAYALAEMSGDVLIYPMNEIIIN